MKNEKTKKAITKFVENMSKLYEDAEWLRDCTEEYEEKQIFNQTRNALHELMPKASELSAKWNNK